MPRKSFCRLCAFYRANLVGENCDEPSNLKDDYFLPNNSRRMTPLQRNRNNDCPGFVLTSRKEILDSFGGRL